MKEKNESRSNYGYEGKSDWELSHPLDGADNGCIDNGFSDICFKPTSNSVKIYKEIPAGIYLQFRSSYR